MTFEPYIPQLELRSQVSFCCTSVKPDMKLKVWIDSRLEERWNYTQEIRNNMKFLTSLVTTDLHNPVCCVCLRLSLSLSVCMTLIISDLHLAYIF